MDMHILQALKSENQAANYVGVQAINPCSREELIRQLGGFAESGRLQAALRMLTDYVGASHYLLARYDLVQERSSTSSCRSDWPFDLVKDLAASLGQRLWPYDGTGEMPMQLFQPSFAFLPDYAAVPDGASRQYCSSDLQCRPCPPGADVPVPTTGSSSRRNASGTSALAGYFASSLRCGGTRTDRDFELTERELECLFWIAEGKTSDEIAMILGISRNTINNYITSVMRKTATKTRSEAIAFAVRNNLV